MNSLVMKSVNAIQLLELIRQRGPISRSDLARLIRLSKPTVSEQVDALIAKGFVREVGRGLASSRGGKKPTLVEFEAAYGVIHCVDVAPDFIRFASADLMGKVLHTLKLPTCPDAGSGAALDKIRSGLHTLLRRDVSGTDLALISIAIPGIVDVRQGLVLETDNVFGWRDVRLGSELHSEFGIPVHVDNDVNMAALAELAMQREHAIENFVLIRLSTGIGAGVVIGGKLYQGAHWAAGEIGHMVLNAGAGRTGTDPRGYLESIVGADRVRERIRLATPRAHREWFDLQAETDGELGIIREDVIAHLALAVANIAAVWDPDAIILLGAAFPSIASEIRGIVARIVPWSLDIRLSKLGEDASLKGALVAGLTHAYQEISLQLDSEKSSRSGVHGGTPGNRSIHSIQG
jgi:predicted NBD/HSP70 family sugar kinase